MRGLAFLAALISCAANWPVLFVAPLTRVSDPGIVLPGGSFPTDIVLPHPDGIACAAGVAATFISSPSDNTLYAVVPGQTIVPFAGGANNTCDDSLGNGGAATSACLNTPRGVTIKLNPAMSVVFADSGNSLVRAIGEDGLIWNLAGTGVRCQSWNTAFENHLAIDACLGTPTGVSAEADSILFTDSLLNGKSEMVVALPRTRVHQRTPLPLHRALCSYLAG